MDRQSRLLVHLHFACPYSLDMFPLCPLRRICVPLRKGQSKVARLRNSIPRKSTMKNYPLFCPDCGVNTVLSRQGTIFVQVPGTSTTVPCTNIRIDECIRCKKQFLDEKAKKEVTAVYNEYYATRSVSSYSSAPAGYPSAESAPAGSYNSYSSPDSGPICNSRKPFSKKPSY